MDEQNIEPGSEYAKLLKQRTRWMWATVFTGIGILFPPIIGLLGTVFGMIRAFGELSVNAQPKPDELAEHISFSLISTAGGLVVALFFLILFVISLIRWLVACSAVTNCTRKS